MDNNISGTSSHDYSSTNYSTSSTGDSKHSSQTKNVLATDTQVFQGMDFISNADIIIQQFSTTQQSGHQGLYQASTQNPILPQPDPEGQTGPQPFEPTWRRAVNKDFMDQLRLVLAKKEGQPSAVQIEARLSAIIQTITSGKTATLSAEDKKVVDEATKQIQTRWKLPTSWTPGTKEATDWMPVSKTVTPPINIELARREVLTNNLEELVSALDRAAQKVGKGLPPDDVQRLGIADIAFILAKAIKDLKAILQDMQVQENEAAIKKFDTKKDAVKDRDTELSSMAGKMKEAMDARREQAKTAKIMRIVAPIISAIVILIGVIALPFTAGGSSALIIAGLAVASVMLAYTAVDAAFNITSKAVQAFNNWLETSFKGDKAWIATLIKATVLTALVVILIVAVVATGGGAAANVATATATQIAKQAVLETIRQLTIQFSLIAIMSSNIVPDLVVKILISSGAVNEKDEQAIMILKMVIAILTMILVMAAVSKGMQRGAENVTKVDKSVQETVKLSDRIREFINDGIKQLKSLPSGLKDSAKEFLRNFDPSSIKEGLKSLGPKALLKDLVQSPEHLPSKIQDIFRMAGLSVQIGYGFYLAKVGFDLAKVYEDMGDIQKAEELTKMLIKLLDQLLASFQEGTTTRSEWLSNLDGAINSIFASSQQILNKATQHAV